MNIVVAKIGKSIKFNSKNWGATGGPNEAPVFFQNIARLNPNDTFYIIGRNDFSRLQDDLKKEVCPNNNFIDIWSEFKKGEDHITYPYRYFKEKGIEIDCGLIYGGSVAAANIPNLLKKKNKDEYINVLETYKNYAAPIVHYLNESKIKYLTLVPDPRYVPIRAEDILNPEKIALTLFDGDVEFERIPSFDKQKERVKHVVKCKYTGIETAYLMDNQFNYQPDIVYSDKKDKKIVIFHNEGGTKELVRSEVLKEYIFDQFKEEDIEVWGHWKEKWFTNPCFKGEMKFNELQKFLPRVKYTFMVPIEKDTLSMKYWESIHNEIIPFMHEFYDISNYTKCPNFLRIKNPEDLKQKIDFLEKNPDEYIKLLKTLKDSLHENMYNGKFMNKHVYDAIEELKRM